MCVCECVCVCGGGDLGVGHFSDAVKIIGGTSGNALEKHLFCHTPSQRHAHRVQHLLLGIQGSLAGQELVVAQGAAATWHYRHLEEGVDMLKVSKET